MLDEILRAKQPELLATEIREHQRSACRMRSEESGELQYRCGSRRVVVSAVVNDVACLGIECAHRRTAEVIDVRSDDDCLAAKIRVGAGKNGYDILSAEWAAAAVGKDRGPSLELLQIIVDAGRDAQRGISARRERRGRIVSCRASPAPFERVAGEEVDIAPDAG